MGIDRDVHNKINNKSTIATKYSSSLKPDHTNNEKNQMYGDNI